MHITHKHNYRFHYKKAIGKPTKRCVNQRPIRTQHLNQLTRSYTYADDEPRYQVGALDRQTAGYGDRICLSLDYRSGLDEVSEPIRVA